MEKSYGLLAVDYFHVIPPMKSVFVILGIFALLFAVASAQATEDSGVGDNIDSAAAVNPNCQAACYQGRAAFIAWCKTMGPGAPCLALANAPPQLFTTQACLRYCNI